MRIVKTYLDIYFKDFYKSKEPFYFPLSGEIVKVKGANFLRKKSESVVTDVINWVWYLRPAFNYFSNIKIIKLRGNSKITSLEKQYKEDNDVALLMDTSKFLEQLNLNNKLYIQ